MAQDAVDPFEQLEDLNHKSSLKLDPFYHFKIVRVPVKLTAKSASLIVLIYQVTNSNID